MSAPLVLFAGPTLRAADVADAGGIDFRPPVSQGDVYRATLDRPWGIGIVDGYFERVPAVWHKEILWALHTGVHVFGAASMGALRAAELATFGMVGVGVIAEAFRDGRLTDDDEVAVRHGPAESGYRAMSEALVNVRVTLAAAVRDGVIGSAQAEALIAHGKRTFYAERTWPQLLDSTPAVPDEARAALRAWLPEGRIDQKRADAVALVAAMRAARAATPEPYRAAFVFEHTDMWEQVGRAEGRLRRSAGASWQIAGVTHERLLDELRLQGPDAFDAVAWRAFARVLGLEEAARQGIAVPPEAVETDASSRARTQLAREEARLAQVRLLYADAVASSAWDVLAADGRLQALAERAAAKAGHVALEPEAASAGSLEDAALLDWYFGERLGRGVPDDLDAYAVRLGLADAGALMRLLRRERAFVSGSGEKV